MHIQTIGDTYEHIERIWAAEKQYVRRILIGLTRDIDLADDLLQETYLKARDGISSYRGDNDRAWLSTIARHAFLAHLRRRYVHAETSGDDMEHTATYSPVGTQDHLELMQVRRAISELDSNLRIALLMKHYCGFTYREISEHTHCAIGTAKWQVSMAIGKLKEVLGIMEEPMDMTCADLNRIKMLDYLYGTLTPDEMDEVKHHLDSCPECRSRFDSTDKILSTLDALESERKLVQIVELDENGMPTVYATFKFLNISDQPISELSFCADKDNQLDYFGAQGEELAFTKMGTENPDYPGTYTYSVKLPRPIAPGEVLDWISIFRPSSLRAASKQADDTWAFQWGQLTSVEKEVAYALAIRLPSQAVLVSADPHTTETRVNALTTTLLWRYIQAPNQGFECNIQYRLTGDKL